MNSTRKYRFNQLLKKNPEKGSSGSGILTTQYLKEGRFPIVDQGKTIIAGFSNDPRKVISIKKPVIIFGDHTRIFKFIDFDFIPGADGTKIIIPNYDLIDPKLFYLLLKNSTFPNDGYNRHFKYLKDLEFTIPDDLTQQSIIADLISDKLAHVEQMRQAALEQKEAAEALQGAKLREVFPYKEGDELPKGWKWEKIGNIMTEERELLRPNDPDFKSLPFIGLENIRSNTREYTNEEYNPPSSTCFKFSDKHVLYGKLRPYLNKVLLPENEGKCSMEILPLVPKDNYDKTSIAAILQSEAVLGDTIKFSTGGRMPRADTNKLKKLTVAIPADPRKCNEISEKVAKNILKVIQINKIVSNEIEAIEALPAAFLREVFDKN